MSAAITGASGFIGQALARRLVSEGRRVICIGRRDPGIPGIEFRQIRELAHDQLSAALRDEHVEVVFHLAAYGVVASERDSGAMFDVNVAGTAAVVSAAAAHSVKSVVYAGSCSEYEAAPSGIPIEESYRLTTDGIYGPSKAAGGLWGQALGKQLGIAFVWVRLFGVYGPGEAPRRLLPTVALRLANNLPVDLSTGDQIRDVLHIDDVVEGLIRASQSTSVDGSTLNLCSGQALSVKSFVSTIADVMGKPHDLLNFGAISRRPEEVMWMVGSNATLIRATGFRPRFSLVEGLTRSVQGITGLAGEYDHGAK